MPIPSYSEQLPGDPPDRCAALFVGGTGRSGTTAVGHLLGAHSAYCHPRFELKLHTDGRVGLPALVAGRCTLENFTHQLWSFWFRRPGTGGDEHGLHRHITRERLEAALEVLGTELASDPIVATRGLLRRLMDPIAHSAGADGWIDTTPSSVAQAEFLHRLIPDLKAVHCVRNGLDAACSVVARSWGPDDLGSAICWWEDGLRRSFAGTRALPADQVFTVQFEDLVLRERERRRQELLQFIGLDEEPALKRYFDRHMTPERANVGRWRQELRGPERRDAEISYSRALARLRADGVTCTPDDAASYL